MTRYRITDFAGALALLSCLAAAAPTSAPAHGDAFTMGDDQIHLFGPPKTPWVHFDQKGDTAKFVNDAKDGAIQIQLLQKDARVDSDIADNVAVAAMKAIRASREKAGVKVVMPATVEKDSRFPVKIHEKYKVGDKTADQFHLYKAVGPRVLLVIVSSTSDKQDAVDEVHHAGENVLLSAKFNKDAGKGR